MKIIPSTKPYISKKQRNFINRSLANIFMSGRLILGPYTQAFEKEFASYIGTKYAIATNSCTSALEIALRFFNVKDSEVIVPTNTFVASANAVIFSGGTPVLADIDKESLCLDVDSLKEKINEKTKAVIVVHIGGLVHPHIDEIKKICRQRKLVLIEDVAHALGAKIDKKKAGNLGDVACFSFYPTKVITTGVGGMITTNNKKLAEYSLILRHHGATKGLEEIQELGNDWLLDEMRAAMGIAQLREIETMIKTRRAVAKRYHQKIRNLNLKILQNFPNIHHVYYKFPVLFESKRQREDTKTLMTKFGIETGSIYYPPVHLMPLYKKMYKFKSPHLPVAEDILPRVLCLPVFVQMTEKEVDFVVESLKNALSSYS